MPRQPDLFHNFVGFSHLMVPVGKPVKSSTFPFCRNSPCCEQVFIHNYDGNEPGFPLGGKNDQILEVNKTKWMEVFRVFFCIWGVPNIWRHRLDCASSASTSEQPEHCAPMDADFGSKLAVPYGRFPLLSLKPPCSNTS